MPNSFYNATENPIFRSHGSSSVIRGEFNAIEMAFSKLPVLAGNGSDVTVVNAAGTALEAINSAQFVRDVLPGALRNLHGLASPDAAGQFVVSAGAGLFEYQSGNDARSTLGLSIGTDVQAFNSNLQSIADLAFTSNRTLLRATTSGVIAIPLSTFMEGMLSDANAATARGTINAQARDTRLDELSSLGAIPGNDNIIRTQGGGWAYEAIPDMLQRHIPSAVTRETLGLAESDAVTFGDITIASGTPQLTFVDTNQEPTEMRLGFIYDLGHLNFSILADNDAIVGNILSISRTGNTVDTIDYSHNSQNTTHRLNGNVCYR